MYKFKYLLALLLLCSPACWERQDHDILPPRIPYYTLSGYAFDLDDTTQVLPYTPIYLQAKALLYDVTFEDISILSDGNGYYQIDSVSPGIYVIYAGRGGYSVVLEQFVLGHVDLVYDLGVPKPLLNKTYYENLGGSNPRLTWGFDGLWILGDYKPEGLPPEPVIYHCTLEHGALGWDERYDNPIPGASCFTYANGNFYEYFGRTVTLLHPQDMKPVSSILLEELLMGLTWDGSGFWSTFEHALQYRGTNLSTVDQSWVVDAGILSGLALKDDHFWTYDSYRNLLLKLSNQGIIIGSYRPIFTDAGTWITVYDMEVGWDGHLWISSKSGEIYTLHIGD